MKVVILAGGLGTRLSEETDLKPKPMVEIGGRPMLWHIMKHYYSAGFNEFIILGGYKCFSIKEFFVNYSLYSSDVIIDTASNKVNFINNQSEKWKVTVLDTGLHTMTGGRIKRAQKWIGKDPFMLTYGDGVSNVDLKGLLKFHKQKKGIVTLTAVQPEGRYGALHFSDNNAIVNFAEKPKGDGSWINGGFFVCEPEVFKYLDGDETIFERSAMERLAQDNELFAYKHHGFWRCMDNLRDKIQLQSLWEQGDTPWLP